MILYVDSAAALTGVATTLARDIDSAARRGLYYGQPESGADVVNLGL
jgi:hypothetical protein